MKETIDALESVKFKVSEFKELQKVNELLKEITYENLYEYITPLELISIIEDFADIIFKLQDKNRQLQKEIDEGLEHYYYPRNFGI